MSDQQTTTLPKKNKGGRPRIPDPPRDSGECRQLIAQEVIRTNPRERTLRQLYKLLKAFERSEQVERESKAIAAKEEANRIAAEQLEFRKSDYRLRFAKSPLGVRSLLAESERLRARIAELEGLACGAHATEGRELGASAPATPSAGSTIDCGVMPTSDGKDGHVRVGIAA